MSTNNKKKNKSEINYKEIAGYIILYLIGVITGIIVMFAIQLYFPKNNTNEINSQLENQISTYSLNSNKLEYNSTELNNACDNIINTLTALKYDNTYIQLQVGDNIFDTYIYNKKGECFAQSDSSGYTSLALSDGRTLKVDAYSESVIIESDTDVLSLMIKTAELAKTEENFTVYDMILDNSSVKEYRIDIIGEENIRKLYGSFGEQIADNIMYSLQLSLGEDWEPHLIFCYLIENNYVTLYTYVVADNQEYVNFMSQGNVTLGDWELSSDYYNLDLNSLDYDTACKMLENTVYDLEQVLQTYALENGLIEDTGEVETETEEELVDTEEPQVDESETIE